MFSLCFLLKFGTDLPNHPVWDSYSVLWKTASGSYDCQVVADAGSENCENSLRAETALVLQWCHKKTSQNLKSNVFLNAIFFFWNILALRGINIMFKFIGFRNKKKSFCHRWQVVCKVLSRGKSLFSLVYKRLCLWFKCWWNHTLANTLFIWDGKIADV